MKLARDHTGRSYLTCNSEPSCDSQMRQIQNDHIRRGLGDIGYNFCIGNDGVVYEGRGWNRHGAHAVGFNAWSIGFSFIGNFDRQLPSQRALDIARAFANCARDAAIPSRTYSVWGHRNDFQSDSICPGNALFNNLRTLAKWSTFNIRKLFTKV
jgi:peptidoglycan recognition protein